MNKLDTIPDTGKFRTLPTVISLRSNVLVKSYSSKMKTLYSLSRMLPIVIAVLVLSITVSCKKATEIEDASTSRSFKPSGLSYKTVKDSAIFKWNMPLYGNGKALTYTLELSTDSLFSTVDYSTITDTTGAVVTDAEIQLNTPYYTRVKVNEYKGVAPSVYTESGKAFKLTGQQFFRVIRDYEVGETTVLLHWYINASTAGLSNVVLTPANGGQALNIAISAADAGSGEKLITGLTASTKYTAQLFSGTKSKGLLSFATADPVVFTTTISPTDNLATVIAAAVTGDVIGLNPGTYNLASSTFITQKAITLRSVSNNPADTKIKCRELNLTGTDAGISLIGIEFDGNYSGTSYGNAFIQLYGTQATTNVDAVFSNIKIDNCIIHDYLRCIIRGNYGAAALSHKIGNISINNSKIYNIDKANAQGYYMFSFEKLLYTSLSITKSTLYSVGSGLLNTSTTLNGSVVPSIKIDYCTINSFSGNSKYALMDANANKVAFSITNSILANTPISGSVNAAAVRGTAAGNVITFSNSNYFNLLTAASGGAPLNMSALSMSGVYTINLGWNANTTDFKLTQSVDTEPILAASTNGGTIGDPRWAY